MSPTPDDVLQKFGNRAFGLTPAETQDVHTRLYKFVMETVKKRVAGLSQESLINMPDSDVSDLLVDIIAGISKNFQGKEYPFAMFDMGHMIAEWGGQAIAKTVVKRTIVFVGDKPLSPNDMAEMLRKSRETQGGENVGR